MRGHSNTRYLGDESDERFEERADRLTADEQGQDLIEYAFLATFVSLVAVAGATLLGTALNNWYSSVAERQRRGRVSELGSATPARFRSGGPSGSVRPFCAGPDDSDAIPMRTLLHRLVHEDRGQDLVEYALLATVIGLVGAVAFQSIMSAIRTTYGSWNASNNNNWQMPDPGSGS